MHGMRCVTLDRWLRGIVLASAVTGVWSFLGADPPRAFAADDSKLADEIAALVAKLGDDDYAVREVASVRLTEIGAPAADALLEAAEVSGDLEVSMRAKWLADSLPLASVNDSPEVTAILEVFSTSNFTERVKIMHRLLRLDDDVGIEPLARIVRLERTPTGSRIAAALLAREWQTDDPYWPGLGPRITAGLGPSKRPAARFLRGVVDATTAKNDQVRSDGLATALAAVDTLDDHIPAGVTAPVDITDESNGVAQTGRVFRRCLAELLVQANKRDQALAQAEKLFRAAEGAGDPDGSQVVADLEWLTLRGLPESVDFLEDRLAAGDAPFLLDYASAVAWQARKTPAARERAEQLATVAARKLADADNFAARLQTALLLARWGADAWAEREYHEMLEDRESPQGLRALAAVYASEYFHDRQRDSDAAKILDRELEDRRKGNDVDGAFMQIERDPRAVRSRMLYFQACAAAAAGDKAGQRENLEASLKAYPKDVDTLIALYKLPDNTEKQKTEIAERVTRALAMIEDEIRALPDDPTSRNEYAWLTANTKGDVAKALEYSRGSLENSFDSSSYLDTLAHCHAAAGNVDRAIRTQWIAVRNDPKSQTIRRNLDGFKALKSKP